MGNSRRARSGVRGYFLVGCTVDELAAGIRTAHRGAFHLSPQIASRLADSILFEALTAREEQVLRLVVEGHCNKAIGRQLGIAVGTVKSHLKSTFDKLRVESRTQAIVAVERRGLLGHRHDAGRDPANYPGPQPLAHLAIDSRNRRIAVSIVGR